MEKKGKPLPYGELELKFGRGLIAQGSEIDTLLKGFEQSGGCDNRGLYNLLVGISKYVSGHTQILSEVLQRLENLESKK